MVREGGEILLARRDYDWEYYIDWLINDKEKKDKISESAYQFVKEKYNARDNKFDKVLTKAIIQTAKRKI